MSGQTVVDVGTGHGMLAIVAILQGAGHVYLLDSNPDAISSALKNAELNGVGDRVAHLPIGKTMIPLPPGELVDMVLSNPAQLPLPESGKDRTHFYVGGDGREMIDEVIRDTPKRLTPSGRLLMVQNSMTNLSRSLRLMDEIGLQARVVAEQSFELPSYIDRAWLDELGGTARGLYSIRDDRPFGTLYVVEATLS